MTPTTPVTLVFNDRVYDIQKLATLSRTGPHISINANELDLTTLVVAPLVEDQRVAYPDLVVVSFNGAYIPLLGDNTLTPGQASYKVYLVSKPMLKKCFLCDAVTKPANEQTPVIAPASSAPVKHRTPYDPNKARSHQAVRPHYTPARNDTRARYKST